MRHNQNGRRYRGRGNGGGGQNHHHNNHNNNNGQRRINPRVHTFDSNGPDVRIRGNAYQITEKYQALAKDAAAAGDRVLAESYLQHAEHYQRLINEMGDEYNRHQQQNGQNQHQHNHGQQAQQQDEQQPAVDPAESEQPSAEGLADLDQGFLVGPRRRGGNAAAKAAAAEAADAGDEQPAVEVAPRGRAAAAKAAE